VVAVVGVIIAGCSASGGAGMPGGQPTSDTPLPTVPLQNRTQPTPSDYIAGDTIGGRVTVGGAGPFYQVVHDDGTVYALHSTAGLVLVEGTYITAKVGPLTEEVDCGPGRALAMLSFTRQ
jgi:hypothetical protein